MPGYDPAFLGAERALVPLPVPVDAGRTLRRLDHPHFTVLLDPHRRLAAATAVTIDGARRRPLPRTGQWRLDPQAPEHEQAGPELYRRNSLDRGHLVRRLDPMWGTAAEAREAGRATFVYTNAAPQVARFNQSQELWNGLEDHVLEYADAHAHRLVVHTGTVLADDDPVYRGVGVPRRFWKVVAWLAARGGSRGGELAAAAFVLDQTPQLDEADLRAVTARALAEGEVPPLGPFRTSQVPVADVARLTALDLGPLPAADVLRDTVHAAAAADTAPGGWRELTGPGDIVV